MVTGQGGHRWEFQPRSKAPWVSLTTEPADYNVFTSASHQEKGAPLATCRCRELHIAPRTRLCFAVSCWLVQPICNILFKVSVSLLLKFFFSFLLSDDVIRSGDQIMLAFTKHTQRPMVTVEDGVIYGHRF